MKRHNLVELLMNCILLCFVAGSLTGAFLQSISVPAPSYQIIFIILGLFLVLRLFMQSKWSMIIVASTAIVILVLGTFLTQSGAWLETLISFVTWQIQYIGGLNILEEAYITPTIWFWTAFFSTLFYVLVIKLRQFIIPFLLGAVFLFVLWFLGHEGIGRYIWFFSLGFLLVWGASYHKQLSKQFSMPALGYWQACILPISIAIVLTALVIVPDRSRNLQWNGLVDTIQTIEDKINDRFHFTSPRQTFRLSETGFSSSQNELGGPVLLSGDLVLEVSSSAPLYLRGTLLNEYIGTGWIDTIGEIRYRFYNRAWRETRLSAYNFDEPVWTELDEQFLDAFYPQIKAEITHIDIQSSVLFNSQQLTDLVVVRGASTPYFNEKGETFTTRNVRTDEPYKIVSRVPNLANHDFRAYISDTSPAVNWTQPLPESLWDDQETYREKVEFIQQSYMNLPSDLPQRIYDLVQELTEGTLTPLERVFVIQDHLQNHYSYTLEPPFTPANRDFVDYFLFDLYEGYCTYFATAMTVMTRAAGIPARYVEGFFMPPRANHRGIYEVKKLHGHAWVEVYFPGFGWLPFDPTPPGALGESAGSGAYSGDSQDEYWQNYWQQHMEQQEYQNDTPLLPDVSDAIEDDTGYTMQLIAGIILISVFGILILIAGVFYVKYRLHWRQVGKQSLDKQYQAYYQEIVWLLKLYGFPIKQGETPYTYGSRVDMWLINPKGTMTEISSVLVENQFGHYTLKTDDIAHIKAFYYHIRSNIIEIMGYPQFILQIIRQFKYGVDE